MICLNKRTPMEEAILCLLEMETDRFPCDPAGMLRSLGCEVMGYSMLAAQEGCTVQEISRAVSSSDGLIGERCLAGQPPLRRVIYNDAIQSKGRVRATLAHELGHIWCGHLERRPVPRNDQEEESAADAFARCLLCPPPLVQPVQMRCGPSQASEAFGVSPAFWAELLRYQAGDLKALPASLQEELLNRCRPWLDSRRCMVCGTCWQQSGSAVCPVCGSRDIRWLAEAIAPSAPETLMPC